MLHPHKHRTAEPSIVDQIAKFAELHAKGTLTHDEFSQIKESIIGPVPDGMLTKERYMKKLLSQRDRGVITADEFQSKVLALLSKPSPQP